MTAEEFFETGLFVCERKHKCKWQGFRMRDGLGFGVIPHQSDAWRNRHDSECRGRLIQLIEPNSKSVCEWRPDNMGDFFTGCGECFSFTYGTPEENNVQFCPYCGKPVKTNYSDPH